MLGKKLLIIDGHSILYRSYHGSTQTLTLPNGQLISAVYTFVRTMLRFLEHTKPDYFVITFDTKGKNFRHELFEDYKAHRSPMPEDLIPQIPLLMELLEASKMKVVKKEGVEADDIIGTLSLQAKKAGMFTYILSGDRDDLQLVDENTSLLYPQKQGLFKEYTPVLFEEEYGFASQYFVMYKAIVGDASDNIPGISGLGPVAATKLVKGFQTLENLYAYVEEKRKQYPQVDVKKIPFSEEEKEKGMSAKVFSKLEDAKEIAFLSLKLSEIQRNLALEVDLNTCALPCFSKTDFYEKLNRFSFRSLNEQFHQFEEKMFSLLKDRKGASAEKNESAFALDSTLAKKNIAYQVDKIFYSAEKNFLFEKLSSLLLRTEENEKTRIFCIQTKEETLYLSKKWKEEKKKNYKDERHLPPYLLVWFEDSREHISSMVEEQELLHESIAVGEKTAPLQARYHLNVYGVYPSDLEEIFGFLATKKFKVIFDHFKHYARNFQLPSLWSKLSNIKKLSRDTLFSLGLMDYSVGSLRKTEALQEILDVSFLNRRETELALEKVCAMLECQGNEACLSSQLFSSIDYALFVLTTQLNYLYVMLETELSMYPKMKKFSEEVDFPLQFVVAEMEKKGLLVDEKKLLTLKETFEKKIEEMEKAIFSYASQPFNLFSPQQLSVFLFEELALPKTKKRNQGYSTDQDALDELEHLHPVIAYIKEHRYYTKLLSTFILGILEAIHSDQRIHSTFELEKTSTGRLSSTAPNLQNIPVKQEIGRQIRSVFIAPKDKCLLIADYSQIELRFLAHMSEDEKMLESFRKNLDIHRLTAEGLFKKEENITFFERQVAKTINFSVMYGISEFSLAKDLGISYQEAKEYIQAYYRRYPAVSRFMENLVAEAEQKTYSQTLLGRIRKIPEFQSKNAHVRKFAERVAMNAPIQGSAADLIRLAMVRVSEFFEEENLDAHLLHQVHDELLVEVSLKDKERAKILLKKAMEEAMDLRLPLLAEVKEAQNWEEAK